jgi:hypothetical protein
MNNDEDFSVEDPWANPRFLTSVPSPVEPHADLRSSATMMFELMTAYTQAGFSEAQAFDLIKAQLIEATRMQ